jgi:hypothetical protein
LDANYQLALSVDETADLGHRTDNCLGAITLENLRMIENYGDTSTKWKGFDLYCFPS